MPVDRRRKPRPPLDPESLAALALRYVERFATTRAKLASYLKRKVRERGWGGRDEPPVEALVERFASSGYIDDSAYALAKSRSLSARGYGPARLRQSLRAAGIADEDSADARLLAAQETVQSALRFANRRKLGPFAQETPDRKAREKGIAAMVRAGHGFALARAIVDIPAGAEIDEEALIDKSAITIVESV